MTAIALSVNSVQPGRDAEWLATTDSFRSHVRRLGGRKPFIIIRQQFSGPGAAQYVTRTEFDDMAALGEFLMARDRDPEMHEVLAQSRGADFPAHLVSQMIYTLALETGDNDDEQPGTVHWRRTWDVKPGRLGDLLSLSEGAADHALQNGARGFRALRAVVAGPQTGIYSTLTRFDDMAVFGRYFDLAHHDPEVRRLIARTSGPDAPATPLGHGVGVVVQS